MPKIFEIHLNKVTSIWIFEIFQNLIKSDHWIPFVVSRRHHFLHRTGIQGRYIEESPECFLFVRIKTVQVKVFSSKMPQLTYSIYSAPDTAFKKQQLFNVLQKPQFHISRNEHKLPIQIGSVVEVRRIERVNVQAYVSEFFKNICQ